LCLMIMPGRSWVAGIAIAGYVSLSFCDYVGGRRAGHIFHRTRGSNSLFYTGLS
jgi:hypothetical protein